MGNDISTVGGAIATAATSVAAGVTFGQVDALNDAVVDCANFTAKKAEQSVVRHAGETAVMGVATAATSVAAGVTFGQVDALNDAVVNMAEQTAKSAVKTTVEVVEAVDGMTDGIPVIGHVKGGILYACGEGDRGDRAMKSASRSAGVIVGGVGGFVAGGPVGAVMGGVAGGAAMDGITTGVESAIHGEFRPNGQIHSWTQVAKGESADTTIEGIVGGVLTPVMDGCVGLAAGKGVAKVRQRRDLNRLHMYDQKQLDLTPKELLDLQKRIARREAQGIKPAPQPQNSAINENVTYEGEPVPRECFTEGNETVFRGHGEMLTEGNMEQVFENGVPTRGPNVDVYEHALGNRDTNFMSTSRNVNVAMEFGASAQPDNYAFIQARGRNGVDVNATARQLNRRNPFPLENEISIHGGIHANDIRGGFRVSPDQCTWHPNPNYVPPTVNPGVVATTTGAAAAIAVDATRRNRATANA